MSDTFFSPGPVRAAVDGARVASGEAVRPCPVCGTPLRPGQTSACSGKCRAILSRRRRVPLPMAEAKAIRASLTAALEALERYGG
jgi:predicted nucleic acid-binding Zn ribbon protein